MYEMVTPGCRKKMATEKMAMEIMAMEKMAMEIMAICNVVPLSPPFTSSHISFVKRIH